MKKILMLFLGLAFAINSFAQERKISWGVKASYNLSTSIDAVKMQSGFDAGLFGEWRFNKLFTLSPELFFSVQRYKNEGIPSEIDRRYSYINLPILAKFYVLKKLSVDVGPQIGYLLSVNSDYYNQINHFDFSIVAGATYNFGRFLASVRYNVSVINANESLNGVIQAGIGYRF